jgi:ABC-type ATPase with predicted acetyltransferase domain
MKGLAYRERLRWANENVRTISRVIVHPQFRGIGVAAEVVRCVLEGCPTRWVEAVAAMGKVHPFFERAGMTRVACGGEKSYFVYERGGGG